MESVKETINQILEAEKTVEELRVKAREEGKSLVDNAYEQASLIIKEGELTAKARESEILLAGKNRANERATAIKEEGRLLALEQKQSAECNIDKAIAYIVERIKEKYGNC